ncbi:TetR/AcrR family transcriptional regulator [Novosphingobium resinovorum]|uniref:TetR/AcrR family transcriptional regulator n=1 Tax=Novosphingobium resinovorum TaxID=158500 RepID=UPI002ED2DFE2|nr:TetR/AcrR family transcriptional regulator [Novosphingobium resinovorum]
MGRPTKAQAQAWTQELLDTARILFCERGYASASLDELAVRLRCSKHSIYRRFADKEALFVAVVDRDVARFIADLSASGAPGSSPYEILRAMARTYFGFGASRDHAALYAAMNLEATTSPRLRVLAKQWAAQALAPLQDAVAAAIPARHPGEMCEILIDLLDGAANRLRLSEDIPAGIETTFSIRWEYFVSVQVQDHCANTAGRDDLAR